MLQLRNAPVKTKFCQNVQTAAMLSTAPRAGKPNKRDWRTASHQLSVCRPPAGAVRTLGGMRREDVFILENVVSFTFVPTLRFLKTQSTVALQGVVWSDQKRSF